MKKIKESVICIFSLDYRSLALMRIGFGITLLCDLLMRLSDLRIFYTDQGVLPRLLLVEKAHDAWYWSVHTLSGGWQWQLVLFAIAIVAACALIAGYKTTLATVVSWILLISLQNRNPMILQGGDVILRVVLFWTLFLPWGKYMSVDSLTSEKSISQKTFFSAATIAYILQIVIFYFFSGLLKSGTSWHNGMAVIQTLRIDQLTTSFGHFLSGYPLFLRPLSFAVLYLELAGGVLLLSPWKTGPVRTLVIALFALMQVGLNISLHLGLFGLISIVITLGLLPSWFWDTVVKKIKTYGKKKDSQELVVYYDHACGFCFKTVFLLKRLLWLPSHVTIVSSITDEKISKEMGAHNSWIVITPDRKHHYKTDAFKEILKASPLFFWKSYFLEIPLIQKLGDRVYEKIAKKRLTVCLPQNNEHGQRKNNIKEGVVIFLCLYVIIWNINTFHSSIPLPKHLAEATRLDQKWNMFAPIPLTEDGWYVFEGMLRDGTRVDPTKDMGVLSYKKPTESFYKNQRFQKYMMNLWLKSNSDYRHGYMDYVCKTWNKDHTDTKTLQSFQMIFMLEKTNPDGSEQSPQKSILRTETCRAQN